MINSLEILTRSVSEEALRKQASLTLFEVALFAIEIEFEAVDYGVKRDSQSQHSPSGHWCLHIFSGSLLPRILRKWSLRRIRGRRAGDEGAAALLDPKVDRILDLSSDAR